LLLITFFFFFSTLSSVLGVARSVVLLLLIFPAILFGFFPTLIVHELFFRGCCRFTPGASYFPPSWAVCFDFAPPPNRCRAITPEPLHSPNPSFVSLGQSALSYCLNHPWILLVRFAWSSFFFPSLVTRIGLGKCPWSPLFFPVFFFFWWRCHLFFPLVPPHEASPPLSPQSPRSPHYQRQTIIRSWRSCSF